MIYSFTPPPLNNRYYVRIDAHGIDTDEATHVNKTYKTFLKTNNIMKTNNL